MKVQVGKRFKEVATVAQMPAVRRLVEDMKEDALPIASYAKMALDALGYGCDWEVYRPKAVVSFNGRVDDRYFDGSGHLDVWIEFLAFNENEGALDCGVYLSDIWELYEENKHLLEDKMYIRAYVPKED